MALSRVRMRALAALLALWPVLSTAQTADPAPPAILIADRVSVADDGRLIAEGSVEAYQGNQRLTARRIVYDRSTESLQIEGPIRLQDGDSTTILADAAQLDRGLRDGLLLGARMVMDQNMQLAAVQMTRSSGRYTQLYRTSVTSCRICAEGAAPR